MFKRNCFISLILLSLSTVSYAETDLITEKAASYCKNENTEMGIKQTKQYMDKILDKKIPWSDKEAQKLIMQLSIVFNQQCRMGYEHKAAGLENAVKDRKMQYNSMKITATSTASKVKAEGFKAAIDAYERGYNFRD
ncbi:hypothetical protein [Enterobacter quasiroggenkampii]|uniref:hypothetical protein n=1 Tax=Enterobacter quasiroggenkampii TaxID=2497436 RepID=UPI0021D378D6|nr:hypothetical protein [Enterobacter quasiroggenkampii]MCU6386098.1 hypothetical protein [Enterobacter quasiroggenkampii]MCU6395193.1 hypothetical protein [Enterobacter quasiroggenkampii]MCU6404278.1 hypothetical protein [Enterobacter quasiroggenkampii]MCU6417852.1 hypothetical protein [Enterobacter quasiroggenkampii]